MDGGKQDDLIGRRVEITGVSDVFSKAAVEFPALFVREIELGLLFSRGEAVPQGHSDVDPLRCREFQELRQGESDPPTPSWARQVGLDKILAAANRYSTVQPSSQEPDQSASISRLLGFA